MLLFIILHNITSINDFNKFFSISLISHHSVHQNSCNLRVSLRSSNSTLSHENRLKETGPSCLDFDGPTKFFFRDREHCKKHPLVLHIILEGVSWLSLEAGIFTAGALPMRLKLEGDCFLDIQLWAQTWGGLSVSCQLISSILAVNTWISFKYFGCQLSSQLLSLLSWTVVAVKNPNRVCSQPEIVKLEDWNVFRRSEIWCSLLFEIPAPLSCLTAVGALVFWSKFLNWPWKVNQRFLDSRELVNQQAH